VKDPLEVPEYVARSFRAWCATHPDKQTEHVSEAEYMQHAPDYDPESDWMDEPFPEEYE